MTDDKTVRNTTVLVNHQEVCNVVSPAGVHQLVEFVASSV